MSAKQPYTRANSEARKLRSQEIFKLVDLGLNGPAIAKKMNVSNSTVYDTLRAAGVRTKQVQSAPALRRRVGKTGYLAEAVAAQGADFESWVVRSVPEGSSIAEFVVSCAVDAFNEETEAA